MNKGKTNKEMDKDINTDFVVYNRESLRISSSSFNAFRSRVALVAGATCELDPRDGRRLRISDCNGEIANMINI